MLLLVIQVWGPLLISHFPVCTPSDSFPPAERLGERSPAVSEETQSSPPWLGQRHRVEGPAAAQGRGSGLPFEGRALLPDSFLGPPAGLRTMHILHTNVLVCLFCEDDTVSSRQGCEQAVAGLSGGPSQNSHPDPGTVHGPLARRPSCAPLVLLAGLLPSRPMRGITGHPSPSPGSQLTCFGI